MHTSAHRSKARDNNTNTITITAGRRDDESSSENFKEEDERGLTREQGKIMQTKEVAVEYGDGEGGRDQWGYEHEMDDLRRTNKSL